MGTRSLTVLYDSDEESTEIAVLYRQFGGYPSAHGEELATFLKDFTVVDGIGFDSGKVANGGACLAAQVIAFFKTEVGGFYLYPAGTRNTGEEYIYEVRPRVMEGIALRVIDGYSPHKVLFDGYVEQWDAAAAEEEEGEEEA